MKQFFLIATMLLVFGAAKSQTYIRQGQGDYNTVLYTWDGKYLRKGQGDYNTVLYTISGKVPTAVLIFISE